MKNHSTGVSHSTEQKEVRSTLIQKVLVLGHNPALMAGYVNRVSGSTIAYHLYASLGVGIGVARTRSTTNHEIVMQMWLIPQEEKIKGINESFKRGHSGAIVVLAGDQLDHIHDLIEAVDENAYPKLLVVVIGTTKQTRRVVEIVAEKTKTSPTLKLDIDIRDSLIPLGNALASKYSREQSVPCIIRIRVEDCPEYYPEYEGRSIPECTVEEIHHIQETAEKIGASITSSSAILHTADGQYTIDLRTGEVNLSPITCQFCSNNCKRNSNICIIALESGWSSEDLGKRALLILAKIWGIHSGNLPQHVHKQIRYATQCNKFLPDENLDIDTIEQTLFSLGYKTPIKRKTMLKEASDRVSDQRMSHTTYNMLKSKMHHVLSKRAQEGK
ncbi:MAG: hypothetical protein P1Q69_18835 [Candidatus Thorarchaeota archaeon]|nr:hypothetical protein [Candidatus Thorarchaeota archaeon]